MTNHSHGGTPADETFLIAWEEFEAVLADYLAGMVDPDNDDHLILELPSDEKSGTTPYVQFAGFGGTQLRSEVSSNCYLGPDFLLDAVDEAFLAALGLDIDTNGAGPTSNWYAEQPVDEAAGIARVAVVALRDVFGIAHPELLAARAWGPAAAHVETLGLAAPWEVPVDVVPPAVRVPTRTAGPRPRRKPAYLPRSRAKLLKHVERVLAAKYDGEPTADDDGDFVVEHMDQPVWVRARDDQPAVEIFARVAHGVRSRRATAVEIALLNRDHLWVKWELRGRDVWLRIVVPGFPFAPAHLDAMLDVFTSAMTATRDDLALRVGGRTA